MGHAGAGAAPTRRGIACPVSRYVARPCRRALYFLAIDIPLSPVVARRLVPRCPCRALLILRGDAAAVRPAARDGSRRRRPQQPACALHGIPIYVRRGRLPSAAVDTAGRSGGRQFVAGDQRMHDERVSGRSASIDPPRASGPSNSFVTGSVVSSLGRASRPRRSSPLLETLPEGSRHLKLDPYINVDPCT